MTMTPFWGSVLVEAMPLGIVTSLRSSRRQPRGIASDCCAMPRNDIMGRLSGSPALRLSGSLLCGLNTLQAEVERIHDEFSHLGAGDCVGWAIEER